MNPTANIATLPKSLGEADAEQLELIDKFAGRFLGSSAAYYARQFKRIGDVTGFAWTFNWAAALLGPIWFGTRNLWKWFLPFIAVETFAVVQISRGIWGDLAAPFLMRVDGIEKTLTMRREQLAAAQVDKATERIASFENSITSLTRAIDGIKAEALRAQEAAVWLIVAGLAVLIVAKLLQGVIANPALAKRFSQWRSDRGLRAGIHPVLAAASVGLALLTYVTCVLKFGFPSQIAVLNEFPTVPSIQSGAANAIKAWMTQAALKSQFFFDGVIWVIRTVLDALETLFVLTPWPVMGGFIVLLAGLSAGWRVSVFAVIALAYLGYFGFWDKSMKTLALLGTAACISIAAGIPLGVLCARKPRLYAFVRPVLDFMQTMPAFVYLIPVIAFFGTGKPAAIVATMIFGGTPVVRLTVLGLRGVPKSVREAAMAFGASNRYLLWKVDLPLAAPSIMAGINQTIMLSLAMVVIASLIGAKGLGEDVLEALQYASEGKGILAGLAILFCAMILDRIVQGRRK
jgi:glycine betaine/proline transport system permease protein